MQADVAIGEEHKCRRRDRCLRHVEDTHLLGHGHGRALEVDFLEKAIHLSGGDALAPLGRDALHGLKHALDALALGGRDEDHRRIFQVLENVSYLRLKNRPIRVRLAVGARRGDQVPLVHDNDDRAPALMRVPADGRVRRGDALGRVDHQERHV